MRLKNGVNTVQTVFKRFFKSFKECLKLGLASRADASKFRA